MIHITFDNIVFGLQKAGGISVVWYELLKRALKDNNVSAKVLDYGKDNIFRRLLDIPIDTVISDKDKVTLWDRYRPVKIHSSENMIFHSSYFRIVNSPKVQNVTTVHDFTYEKYLNGMRHAVHIYQKKYAINHADRLICVSHNTKKDLLEYFPHIDESKVAVVYNGVDTAYHQLSATDKRQIECKFDKKGFLLYVGDRKCDYKNFDLVVALAAQSHIPLVIVGGGALSAVEKERLHQTLDEKNYQHFIGLSNDALNELYNDAFALVYPSKYEGFGVPILEAQAAGCLVIAGQHSSIPEVSGQAAFLLQDLSLGALSSLVMDLKSGRIKADKYRQQGFINARKFSWDKSYEHLIREYNKLC